MELDKLILMYLFVCERIRIEGQFYSESKAAGDEFRKLVIKRKFLELKIEKRVDDAIYSLKEEG